MNFELWNLQYNDPKMKWKDAKTWRKLKNYNWQLTFSKSSISLSRFADRYSIDDSFIRFYLYCYSARIGSGVDGKGVIRARAGKRGEWRISLRRRAVIRYCCHLTYINVMISDLNAFINCKFCETWCWKKK